MSDSAIETAAQLDEIPFVDFTTDLLVGVFDALIGAHVQQTEQYVNLVQSLTSDLQTYINNTKDGVDFEDISAFILAYDLPAVSETQLNSVLDALSDPSKVNDKPVTNAPATTDQWWGGLMNAVTPAINGLVDKIPGTLPAELDAVKGYNSAVLTTMPTYKQIHDSIASLLASNKYALLQNLARQGMMRLVVTDGEVETKLTFSTWNTSETSVDTRMRDRVAEKVKTKLRRGTGDVYKRMKQNKRERQVTVNTARTHQRDTSGTKIDIFGHVLVRFKSDFAPLSV